MLEPGSDITMTIDQRKAQPLYVKIENVMPLVLKNAAKRTFVERQFKMPVKDPDVGLYVLPSGKYF
jgi:hypothetical protein